ncbi:MAG: DUF2779 domain-containing protein [Deltaproteobacteria bacterium]|nr:DUF2779 domain-containing protein [Deltaproteobacteria bacterium]MDH3383623.1 DUF2779 domain-containing protein [Deltaproteobacteria bacterium]
MRSPAHLSKTLYMRGLQCPKSLWLDRKQPEVRTAPPPDLIARWDAGTEVGRYAQLLFPGGVEVPFDGRTKVQQLSQTRDLLAKGAQTIYEATFSSEGVLVRADILRKTRDGWELYEVKSASDVKPHFPDDVAIQYFVLSGCQFDLRRAFLVHIDTGYVRRGEIVPQELFAVQEVTDIVRGKQSAIPAEIARMREVLAADLPAIDIGPQCTNPYECDFIDYCWRHIPEHSIFDLKGRGVDKWDLYRKGIVRMDDVPLEALNNAQRMQVKFYRNRGQNVDLDAIREFLEGLPYPICFLDFETFDSPIPPFDGTRPYQQIPFLYSLHRQDSPGGRASHSEFLAPPGKDPREALTERLLAAIPEGACVLAYNKTFEARVLKDLAERFPVQRERLLAIAEGMLDLMIPFRRRDIYDWRMDGSYSLKNVLPVLVPELSYEGLAIQEGTQASLAYLALDKIGGRKEREKAEEDLRAYCRQDTLGMVKLLEKMRELAK